MSVGLLVWVTGEWRIRKKCSEWWPTSLWLSLWLCSVHIRHLFFFFVSFAQPCGYLDCRCDSSPFLVSHSIYAQGRQWHPTPVLLPGKSHGQRSLVGCSPRGRWELDTTERLPFHFSLSCVGEGNGNPLQCSCLESPRDGGAWWAAVYGVAQSRTWLKRLSSSSSSNRKPN